MVAATDDGIATGATVRAAIAVLRSQGAARIVVATPVMPADTFDEMSHDADEIVAVSVPRNFRGVGEWYDDFSPTSDDEVLTLLSAPTAFAPST
jgi:predicted phosphoribosyltransferase